MVSSCSKKSPRWARGGLGEVLVACRFVAYCNPVPAVVHISRVVINLCMRHCRTGI